MDVFGAIPKIQTTHFPKFNALWLGAKFKLTPYFLWNIIFDLSLFLYTPTILGIKQERKKSGYNF
jgi:hypothetical protein